MIDKMYVNTSEFRANIGKYIDIATREDVFILKHGRPIVVVSASQYTKQRIIDSLAGSLKIDENADIKELTFRKRMEEYESLD